MLELIKFFLHTNEYILVMAIYVIVYTFTYGANNTYHAINSLITRRKYIQSDVGKILDMVWVGTIIYVALHTYQNYYPLWAYFNGKVGG